jgi:beta-phosphoglucomutase family hydrolase
MQPLELRAWLFDLDGVLTDTARVHVAAWKEVFDEVLGSDAAPFDAVADYLQYVDGKPRAAGVRDFLASRGVVLPEGARDDSPARRTVWGIGNRKNERFRQLLDDEGVHVFPGAVRLVRALRDAGHRTGVVSASENCRAVLDAAGISGLFYAVVDGSVAAAGGLAGKPAPDTFLYGARLLDVEPRHGAVVEDAPAGVAAGRAGGFGYVVGVARRATAADLLAAGADVAVADLAEFGELFELLARMRMTRRAA